MVKVERVETLIASKISHYVTAMTYEKYLSNLMQPAHHIFKTYDMLQHVSC